MNLFPLGGELMLRPSIRGLYLGEVRNQPGKVLWFRPQNIRLVLAQLASLNASGRSRNSGTWTSSSRRSDGCRSRRGGGGGGGGGGRSRSTTMMPMGTSSPIEPGPKLPKERENKRNSSKNMDNRGPEKN